jgi:alkylation response protein AidB-like acyl-CoA dehydrogenase
VAIMMHQALFMAGAADNDAALVGTPDPSGRRPDDDGSVAYRLGRAHAHLEVALSSPSIFGRVAIAQTMRDISPDLMDIAGSVAALPIGSAGGEDDRSEYVYRFAPLVGIYGGTLEVFRNMIAQHVLGMGKPNYSPPAARKVS